MYQKISLLVLRLSLGWLFFYAGITKILDSTWSAAGYLNNAQTFSGLYAFFANPNILPFINFINKWGLALIGIALIVGICIRIASLGGIILMALYYFPILKFPYPNSHSFIVDEHIIYISAFLVLMAFQEKIAWSLKEKCLESRFCAKYPLLKKIIS